VHHETCQSVSLSNRSMLLNKFCLAVPWRFEEIAVREVACPGSVLRAYIYFMPPENCEERPPALLLVYVESF